MTTIDENSTRAIQERWLCTYYISRAAFSATQVISALTLGQSNAALGAILLVIYPLWDAAANYVDAARNGGLAHNPTQAFNVLVSLTTTLAVFIALQIGLNAALTVFGVWAILSGLLQLGTAIRRWKSSGAQWAMILSGGQSALAGVASSSSNSPCRRSCLSSPDTPHLAPSTSGFGVVAAHRQAFAQAWSFIALADGEAQLRFTAFRLTTLHDRQQGGISRTAPPPGASPTVIWPWWRVMMSRTGLSPSPAP